MNGHLQSNAGHNLDSFKQIPFSNWYDNAQNHSVFIWRNSFQQMGQFCTEEFTIDKLGRALVVLCKVGDGLGEAVEPGIGGHQHQEGHGDNLHCAGGETLLRWTDCKISPPGAKLPLLRDGQLPPLQALRLLRGLLLGEALARGVHLGSHLLQGCRQRLDGCLALSMVEALLRYFLRWAKNICQKGKVVFAYFAHITDFSLRIKLFDFN